MMQPVLEVVIKGTDKPIGFACGKCHRFCSPLIYVAKKEAQIDAARQHAESCCKVNICKRCGNRISSPKEKYWTVCYSCRRKVNTDVTKVLDVLPPDYDNMLYSDGRYYSNMEDYLDMVEPEDRQESIYLTKKDIWKGLDIGWALESSLEEFTVDGESPYLKGLEELNEAVNKFNALNPDVYVYYDDPTLAVKVPKD